MSDGPIIGEGSVHRGTDGVIRGAGKWCGFPFVIELHAIDPATGHRGYRLVMRAAPQAGVDPLVDDLLCLPYKITKPLVRKK
jgi:hypothetical protein